MKPTVQFLFDFGSPNAYLCHKVIPALEKRNGIKVQYEPILLGGLFKLSGNQSPIVTTAGVPNKSAYDKLEMRRFIEQHALNAFQFNPNFPVNTLTIMRGAVAAQKQGCFEPYVKTMFAAMWEQKWDLAQMDQVIEVLNKAGLDAAVLIAGTQDTAVKAELVVNTQSAFDRGAFGSPTFFVGGDMYFGKDRLESVEAAIKKSEH